MRMPTHFISCDWGTTNFRLRVVETESLQVHAEHWTDQGIKTLYEKFRGRNKGNQTDFFADYLKEQITALPALHQEDLIVAIGMASSNIGLYELEYAKFPFGCEGDSLNWKHLSLKNGLNVVLASGVKTETGMMRGEEIQVIGLEEHLNPFGKGILLLPGTHSKHIKYDGGIFLDLKNYMTGELFEILSRKSILYNSVTSIKNSVIHEKAFKEGLLLGFDGLMSASLFCIRARHILDNADKEDNFYFLSGLLIGDELSYLKNSKEKIFLVAPDPVFSLYKMALELILDPGRLVLLKDNILENALLIGQRKILAQYELSRDY